MNSFKRTMTAVGTAVVLTAVGALAAPAAHAAPGAAPVSAAADAEAKAAKAASGVYASIFQRAHNEFAVYLDDVWLPKRVEVRRAGTDKVVAVVDDLTYHQEDSGESGVEGRDWYEGDKPLVLDDMADYELDVYSGANGDVITRSAGRSTYALDARIEAKSSQQEFSLDDLDTQVTGTVTAVHPRTGERLPLAGARVRAALGEGSADVVSDAQGKFATSVSALGTESQASMYVNVALASGDTETRVSTPAKIRAQKAALTLSTTGPFTARYGTKVTLRGTLTRTADNGTVKPAAGRRVLLSGIQNMEAFAGADGSYTALAPVYRPGSLNVAVGDSWLVGDRTRTATVTKITHMTKVTEEKIASSDKYGKLTISGKVTVDGYTTQQASIEIQYSDRGRWVTRQSFVVPYNKTFSVTVSTPSTRQVSGWRVYTPGTTNIAPSTGTQVLRTTRTETRITDARFGPRTVAKGKQLFVLGVLNNYSPEGGYTIYPGQKVRFYFRPDGSTEWKEMGTAVTRADGSVGKKFTAETSGYWRIRFVDADASHLASTGMEGRIRVTG
ncbi:hypothetical protein [Streptomyces sp. NBC_01264]|uniref:hypothetical protein n=1 Tax=Streptomyces sp. NBC_01264 TaxID=2903804 RepID=UPI0022503831|nr:hypothetical protein [Streptomyces sp. NBC_01264]MCX4779157.1 hypothetical protein [Streptomyces sp. NBC_01264]